jgi:hypothetical protein
MGITLCLAGPILEVWAELRTMSRFFAKNRGQRLGRGCAPVPIDLICVQCGLAPADARIERVA